MEQPKPRSPIEQLEKLLPRLEGKVYRADYVMLATIYDKVRDHTLTPVYVECILRSLKGVVSSDQRYKTNPESRSFMVRSIGILEDLLLDVQ